MNDTSSMHEPASSRGASLRTGYTTGTCAAAAAKHAAALLSGQKPPSRVEVPLPSGIVVTLGIEWDELLHGSARAAVRKDAGDDPDVTDGSLVIASAAWAEGDEVLFAAGEGVGTATKPGLSIPPGEPAINPVPRRMIRDAVREVTRRGVLVEISIPGGEELAARTFNPRLGIKGGLSILGTSGIVRPFSTPALRDALKCALDVAIACGVREPVLVPGRIGEKAARRHFGFEDHRLIEVGNEWGFLLDLIAQEDFDRVLVMGHPGKLAKLAGRVWDTHSSRSGSAAPWVRQTAWDRMGLAVPESPTVEGILAGLPIPDRDRLAGLVAESVRNAVWDRIKGRFPVTVVLVDMRGNLLATDGCSDVRSDK